jgi:hypothetical protein
MTAMCGFEDQFADQMPADVLAYLLYCCSEIHGDLKFKVTKDRSYAAGAYCLRELIKRRKAEYQERRRN